MPMDRVSRLPICPSRQLNQLVAGEKFSWFVYPQTVIPSYKVYAAQLSQSQPPRLFGGKGSSENLPPPLSPPQPPTGNALRPRLLDGGGRGKFRDSPWLYQNGLIPRGLRTLNASQRTMFTPTLGIYGYIKYKQTHIYFFH